MTQLSPKRHLKLLTLSATLALRGGDNRGGRRCLDFDRRNPDNGGGGPCCLYRQGRECKRVKIRSAASGDSCVYTPPTPANPRQASNRRPKVRGGGGESLIRTGEPPAANPATVVVAPPTTGAAPKARSPSIHYVLFGVAATNYVSGRGGGGARERYIYILEKGDGSQRRTRDNLVMIRKTWGWLFRRITLLPC